VIDWKSALSVVDEVSESIDVLSVVKVAISVWIELERLAWSLDEIFFIELTRDNSLFKLSILCAISVSERLAER